MTLLASDGVHEALASHWSTPGDSAPATECDHSVPQCLLGISVARYSALIVRDIMRLYESAAHHAFCYVHRVQILRKVRMRTPIEDSIGLNGFIMMNTDSKH